MAPMTADTALFGRFLLIFVNCISTNLVAKNAFCRIAIRFPIASNQWNPSGFISPAPFADFSSKHRGIKPEGFH